MKALKVIFGNLHSRIWAIVTACFLVLAIVANIVIFNVVNKVFDNLWGGDSSSGRGEGGAFTLDEGITDKASALENANAVNEEICEEGYVLLKNEGVLPMKTSKDAPKKSACSARTPSISSTAARVGAAEWQTTRVRSTNRSKRPGMNTIPRSRAFTRTTPNPERAAPKRRPSGRAA